MVAAEERRCPICWKTYRRWSRAQQRWRRWHPAISNCCGMGACRSCRASHTARGVRVCVFCQDGCQNLTEWDTVDPPRGGAGDVDCASLQPFPSTKIDAFSRIALHEITHYNSVGPATSLAQRIKDTMNEDGGSPYNLPRVHDLVDSKQDNNPVVTKMNVDSYAWISLDA